MVSFFFGIPGAGRLCYSGVSGAFCHLIHKLGSPQRKRPPFCSGPIRTPQRGRLGPPGVRFNSRGAGGWLTAVARRQSICQPGERVSPERKSRFRREQVVGPEREQSRTFPSSLWSQRWPLLPSVGLSSCLFLEFLL